MEIIMFSILPLKITTLLRDAVFECCVTLTKKTSDEKLLKIYSDIFFCV